MDKVLINNQNKAYVSSNGKALKANNAGRLPAGYQEVEYIRGTGTQWIDTGIPQNICCGIQAKVSFYDMDAMDGCGIAGTNVNDGYASYAHYYSPSKPDNLYIPIQTIGIVASFSSQSINENTIYYIHYVSYIRGINTYHIFGVNNKYCQEWNRTVTLPSTNIGIFGLTTGENTDPFPIGGFDLYSMTLFNSSNGVSVREYIPCYRKSDNEIGLYDLVSETFFTNAGTGIFIKGSDVN